MNTEFLNTNGVTGSGIEPAPVYTRISVFKSTNLRRTVTAGSMLILAGLLSGCVSGSSSNVPAFGLNTVTASEATASQNTDTATALETDVSPVETAVAIPGVPKKRPVLPGEPQPAQLALASTTTATPATQATNNVVNTANSPAAETTAGVEEPQQVAALAPEEQKPKSFLSRLFGQKEKKPAANPNLGQARSISIATEQPAETAPVVKPEEKKKPEPATPEVKKQSAATETAVEPAAEPKPAPKKTGFFASIFSGGNNVTGNKTTRRVRKTRSRPTIVARSRRNRDNGFILPGVRKELFGLGEGDEDVYSAPIRVASVGNLARVGPYGIKVQRPQVNVSCFRPDLVRLLKKVERHFGRSPVVTSGYRSASYNRKVRGARKSTHISCKAADIQVVGVSKWQLARYLRSLPGRGGVGTYCSTNSVHIDTGSKRDWNWRCRRRRGRKA